MTATGCIPERGKRKYKAVADNQEADLVLTAKPCYSSIGYKSSHGIPTSDKVTLESQ